MWSYILFLIWLNTFFFDVFFNNLITHREKPFWLSCTHLCIAASPILKPVSSENDTASVSETSCMLGSLFHAGNRWRQFHGKSLMEESQRCTLWKLFSSQAASSVFLSVSVHEARSVCTFDLKAATSYLLFQLKV